MIRYDTIRYSASHTRYSNGSEFNTSLAARHGSLSQRVRYLLCKRQILVTTLMYGVNGLVQVQCNCNVCTYAPHPLHKDDSRHTVLFPFSDIHLIVLNMQLLFTEMVAIWLVASVDKGGFNLDRNSLTVTAVVSGIHYLHSQTS